MLSILKIIWIRYLLVKNAQVNLKIKVKIFERIQKKIWINLIVKRWTVEKSKSFNTVPNHLRIEVEKNVTRFNWKKRNYLINAKKQSILSHRYLLTNPKSCQPNKKVDWILLSQIIKKLARKKNLSVNGNS